MLIKYVIILALTSLVSCQSKSQQGYFDIYLEKFKRVELPLSISRSTLEEMLPERLVALDSSDIVRFIEPNRNLGGGMHLIDIYKFYPYAHFKISNELDGVIVLKSGGAGGVEMIFYLIVYNHSGKQIDNIVFAKQVGDCSRLHFMTGELSLNFEITIEKMMLISDCESDEYEKRSTQIEIFNINKEGQIKNL